VTIEAIHKSSVSPGVVTPKSRGTVENMPGAYDTFDYAEAHARKLEEKKVTIAIQRKVGAHTTVLMR
jgi:hypothetical protein